MTIWARCSYSHFTDEYTVAQTGWSNLLLAEGQPCSPERIWLRLSYCFLQCPEQCLYSVHMVPFSSYLPQSHKKSEVAQLQRSRTYYFPAKDYSRACRSLSHVSRCLVSITPTEDPDFNYSWEHFILTSIWVFIGFIPHSAASYGPWPDSWRGKWTLSCWVWIKSGAGVGRCYQVVHGSRG